MINNIQALRAFAAIIVVLFHTYLAVDDYGFISSQWRILTFDINKWGAFGVDLFFVISGYLMFMINDKKSRTPYQFLLNRVQRIVPLYWLLTLMLFLVYQIFPSLFREMEYSFGKLISSLFFVSAQFGYDSPGLYVGWTLEYEMFFYIIFAMTLLKKLPDLTRLSILMILIVVSILLHRYHTVAIEFIFGGMIFLFLKKFQNILMTRLNYLYWIIFCIGLILVIIAPTPNDNWRFIVWGIPAVVMFASILLAKDIKSNALVQLGNASYSIYLTQVAILPLCSKVFVKILPTADGFYVFLLISVISIGAGYICYWVIERPLNAFCQYLLIKRAS